MRILSVASWCQGEASKTKELFLGKSNCRILVHQRSLPDPGSHKEKVSKRKQPEIFRLKGERSETPTRCRRGWWPWGACAVARPSGSTKGSCSARLGGREREGRLGRERTLAVFATLPSRLAAKGGRGAWFGHRGDHTDGPAPRGISSGLTRNFPEPVRAWWLVQAQPPISCHGTMESSRLISDREQRLGHYKMMIKLIMKQQHQQMPYGEAQCTIIRINFPCRPIEPFIIGNATQQTYVQNLKESDAPTYIAFLHVLYWMLHEI